MVLFWLFSIARSVLMFLYTHMIKGVQNLTKVYGRWAVVTGATDGIGLSMAHEFARNGMNVVLISRTQSKLDDCANDMRRVFPNVDVKVLAVDFNDINLPNERSRIAKFLAPLEVGVLVNNVGISYPFPKYIHELTDAESEALTVLNVDSTTWMTRIVLAGEKGMIARKKGAIINISSIAGVLTSPLLSHYGGAKSFVAQYSRALHYELAPKASLTVATPGQYASAALKAIGTGVVVSPYWSHDLQFALYQALPEWLLATVANSMHQGIRKAGMKKLEATTKKK
eukprot:GSChrysophyteH1.ASY1.ANO1.3282.1 assembled CDS